MREDLAPPESLIARAEHHTEPPSSELVKGVDVGQGTHDGIVIAHI